MVEFFKYRFWWCTFGVFLLALVVRLVPTAVFVGLSAPPDGEAQPDQLDYELFAYQMAAGNGYSRSAGQPSAERAPGTSFALLPAYWLMGRNFAAGRVWFCVLSALTCVATAALGRQMFGAGVGLLAALGLAIFPNHWYYAMHFLSEGPFSLCIVLAVSMTLFALRRGGTWRYAFAGLLWGAAALIRPNILAGMPVLAALPLLVGRQHMLPRAAGLVVMAAGFAGVVCPWIVRNYVVLGHATTTTIGGQTFWGSHNELVLEREPGGWIVPTMLTNEQHPWQGNEFVRSKLAWDYGLDFVRSHKAQLPYLEAMKLYRLATPFSGTSNKMVFWAFAIGWIVAGPLAAYGYAASAKHNWDAWVIASSLIVGTIITALVFYGLDRFRDVLAPIYLIYAAWAVQRLATLWSQELAVSSSIR